MVVAAGIAVEAEETEEDAADFPQVNRAAEAFLADNQAEAFLMDNQVAEAFRVDLAARAASFQADHPAHPIARSSSEEKAVASLEKSDVPFTVAIPSAP